MKQFKQLTLIFASLLVVALSFSFTKTFDSSLSVQQKTIECHFTALTDDDIDDDLTDQEFQFTYSYSQESFRPAQNLIGKPQFASGFHRSSIPFYLKIRNIRI